MTKSKAAFLFASQTLGRQRLYLWTFTFKELLAVKETRRRWNYLLTLLQRTWPELQGLRVFELHQEHGLHVHLVTNQFIDVNRARELAVTAGWGALTGADANRARRLSCEISFKKSGRSVYIVGAFGLGSGKNLGLDEGKRFGSRILVRPNLSCV